MSTNEIINLRSAEGKELKFEKVADVPLLGSEYAVLAPLEKIPGAPENMALVFEVKREGDSARLNIVSDSALIEEVFQIYAAQMMAKTKEQARKSPEVY